MDSFEDIDGVVLYGGTGQAKVVRPIIDQLGSKVVAIIDDTANIVPPFSDVEVFRGLEKFKDSKYKHHLCKLGFVITIAIPNSLLNRGNQCH